MQKKEKKNSTAPVKEVTQKTACRKQLRLTPSAISRSNLHYYDKYVKEPNLIHLSCVQHPFTLTSWTFLFPGHHFHSLTLCLHLLCFQYLFNLIKPENTNNFQNILLLNTVISSALTQQSSKKMVLNHDVLFSTKYCQITTIVTGEQHLC